jgi:hypothetical protein
VDPWEETIKLHLDDKYDSKNKIHTSKLYELLNIPIAHASMLENNRIKAIMEHLGWKKSGKSGVMINGKRLQGYLRRAPVK